jgi:hypothetical protein
MNKRIYKVKISVLVVPAVIALLVMNAPAIIAQDEGRIVFVDPKSEDNVISEEDLQPRNTAGGVDIMLGNDGFGLGFFYNLQISNDFTAFVNLSFSEAEDPLQRSTYSLWGEEIPVNKLNYVFRIPMFFGIQYRLFSEEIVENFRPFVNAGAGPVMLYVASAKDDEDKRRDFFGSLPHGKPQYTYGGFLGAGAQFGFDRSTLFGVNARYYIIPTPSGLHAVDQGELANANGFFITLNVGMAF